MRTPTAFVLGAAAEFFFDPQLGKRRRHVLRDRSVRVLRRVGRLLNRKARFVAGRAEGVAAEARTAVVKPDVATDDATVKQRIMSDALRDVSVSTGDVDVEVEDGVATLRGSVPSLTLADDLVARVREVPGVREVAPQLTVRGSGIESATLGSGGTELDQGI